MTNLNLFAERPSPRSSSYESFPSPRSVREARAAMSSSSPPVDQYGNPHGGSYGSNNSESGRSALNMSLGFLKTLTEKKSTRGISTQGLYRQ
jgi:hypothetical protein